MFCAKMSGCSHYMYCLQKESTHFGLSVMENFVLGYQDILGPKNHT